MTRRAFRKDTTERAIVRDLNAVGWRVLVLSDYGAPVDLLVLAGEDLYLVDAKGAAAGRRTALQAMLAADGWPIVFATTGEEAIAAISERRRGRP